jgi:hypothetical protein
MTSLNIGVPIKLSKYSGGYDIGIAFLQKKIQFESGSGAGIYPER